jgi:hypothetical protein
VPSKVVKILAVGAVSAGQRPAGPRGISTDSARPIRDQCRFPSGPRPVSSVVRAHAGKAPIRLWGRRRQRTPQLVRRRYILTLTCDYFAFHNTRSRVRGADRPHAAGHPRDTGEPRAERCRADTAASWAGRAVTAPGRSALRIGTRVAADKRATLRPLNVRSWR